jgi:hypothetical protein
MSFWACVSFILVSAVANDAQHFEEGDALSLLQVQARAFDTDGDFLNDTSVPQCPESWMNAQDYSCNEAHRAPCKLKGDSHKRGCQKNQLRCDKTIYQDETSEYYMPCCEKQNVFSMLVSIGSVLCGKVDYGLTFGSLAGAVKERDLSDHDTEAEFMIRSSDAQQAIDLLRAAAEKDGFVVTTRNGRIVINWGPKNLLHVDIWFLYDEGNCAVVQFSDNYVMKFPGAWLAEGTLGATRCWIQGQAFRCPEQPSRLLEVLFPPSSHGHEDAEYKPNCKGVASCCGLEQRILSESDSPVNPDIRSM